MRRFTSSITTLMTRGRSVTTKKPSVSSSLKQALSKTSSIPNTLVKEIESMKKRGALAGKKRSLTPRNRKVLVHNLNEVMTVRTGTGAKRRVISSPSPEDILKIIVKQDPSVTLKTIRDDFAALRIPYLREVEALAANKKAAGGAKATPMMMSSQFNETERRGLVAIFYNILFSTAVLNGELPTVSSIMGELKKQGKSFSPRDVENDLKMLNLKVDPEPTHQASTTASTTVDKKEENTMPWFDTTTKKDPRLGLDTAVSPPMTPAGSSSWTEQVTEKRRTLLTHLYKSLLQDKGAPPSPSTLSKMLELPVELISRDYHDLGLFDRAEQDSTSKADHAELIRETIEKIREVEGLTDNNTELLRILEGDLQRANEMISGLDDKFDAEIIRLDGRIETLATSVSSLTKIVDERETAIRNAPAPPPPQPAPAPAESLHSILRTLAEFGLVGGSGITPVAKKRSVIPEEASDEVRAFAKEQRRRKILREDVADESQALEPLPTIKDALTLPRQKKDLSVDMKLGLDSTPSIGPPLGALDPALVSRFLLNPPKVTRDVPSTAEDESLDWI